MCVCWVLCVYKVLTKDMLLCLSLFPSPSCVRALFLSPPRGPRKLQDDPKSNAQKTFDVLDLVFTGIFTAELLLNLVAHPLLEFFTDAWSVFDFVVVITSIFNMVSSGSSVVSVFRLFRLFRIIRLFGRVKSIRQIINALSASMFPIFNAFAILLICMALFAIVGVFVFAEDDPSEFGNLSLALVTFHM